MSPSRKLVEKYFEKFSTTTVIRVFNFIRISEFLAERLFWIVVLLSFTAASVWSVYGSCRTFMREPTASLVSYSINTTDGLHFDDSAICFEMRSELLFKLYENRIDDVIAEIINNPDIVQSLKQKLHRIHEMEDSRGTSVSYHEFQRQNFDVFSVNDIALLGLTAGMLVHLMEVEANPTPVELDWSSANVRRLFDAYITKETNFSQLIFLTAEMTCAVFQVRLARAIQNLDTLAMTYTPVKFCKNFGQNLKYIGKFGESETICYGLTLPGQESPLTFYSSFDSVMITAHPEWLYTDLVKGLKYVSIVLEGSPLAIAQRPLPARFNQKQIFEFSLETVSVDVSLRRRPCAERFSRKGTSEDCFAWCRLESIVKNCDCMPILGVVVVDFASFRKPQASCAPRFGVEYSTIPARCRVALAMNYAEQLGNCSLQCDRNCETFLFMNTIRPSGSALDVTNASTVIVLKATKFVFQQVEEYVTMDLKGFIAALGGNLSLYLGASFLALIHILVFCARIPFERYRPEAPKVPAPAGRDSDAPLADVVRNLTEELSKLRKEFDAHRAARAISEEFRTERCL